MLNFRFQDCRASRALSCFCAVVSLRRIFPIGRYVHGVGLRINLGAPSALPDLGTASDLLVLPLRPAVNSCLAGHITKKAHSASSQNRSLWTAFASRDGAIQGAAQYIPAKEVLRQGCAWCPRKVRTGPPTVSTHDLWPSTPIRSPTYAFQA